MASRWFLAAWLAMVAMASSLSAQAVREVSEVRRDGHALVRLTVRNAQELAWLEAIGAEPMKCIPGPGVQEFSISPAARAAIDNRGLRYTVLNGNIQTLIDAGLQGIRAQELPNNADGGVAGEGGIGPGTWFDNYKTWLQVNTYMDDLVALRPNLVTKLAVGTTIQGRTIFGMRITGPAGGNKPAVMFTGCQHAREWVAVMVPMYIADALVSRYDTDSQIHALVDELEFFIVPIVNPDGYEYTYAPGGDRLWRKNRRDNGDGTFGVDLNRNWGVDWGGPNSTTNITNGATYYGTGPFSEPESAAVRDFFIARPQIRAHIDFHSYSQLVLQNWAHTAAQPPDVDVIDALGTAMNNSIFAVNSMSYSNGWGSPLLYLASGVMPDWCYGDRGIISYTIELRDRGETLFELPPAQILPTCSENLPAALAMATWVANGVEFFYPRGRPAVFDPSSPPTVNVDVRPTTAGAIVAGSVKVFSRVGSSGPFTATVMTNSGGASYQSLLPTAPCGQVVQWYVEAQASPGGVFRSPADAPVSVHTTRAAQTITEYNFQTTSGWTTSNSGSNGGLWMRVVPTIDPTWAYSPQNDADGSGACYVTGNMPVTSDVSGGTVTLTSPALNFGSFAGGSTANGAGVVFSFSYFLHTTTAGPSDFLVTEVSSNDTTGPWIEVARESVSGGAHWRSSAISQADLATAGVSLTSLMRVRFRVTDGSPVSFYSVVEAGIDAVRISDACEGSPVLCTADIAPVGSTNGAVDIDDLLLIVNNWGATGTPGSNPADIAPTEAGGDGVVNIDDLLAVINTWGPCP